MSQDASQVEKRARFTSRSTLRGMPNGSFSYGGIVRHPILPYSGYCALPRFRRQVKFQYTKAKFVQIFKKYLTILFLLSAFGCVPSQADQQYAISQYDNGVGLKMVVIQSFKSAKCEILIENYFAGLKLDCPECKKEYGGCSQSIPSAYEAVWHNQSFVAPYTTSGTFRMIYSGVSREQAEAICTTYASAIRRKGMQAECIK
ncbi:hypothetical protein [Methylocaldum sp. GT1TLB]|jgi:hypothetical protein|uniref:hypothetical protein n=1 Tax=unclassified Methylocaldum TaxID=2622260 RepID=UPI003DA0E263